MPPPPALQPVSDTLSAVQSAGVQAVTTDVCTQLAQLALSALKSGNTDVAQRIIAVAFAEGGSSCRAVRRVGSGSVRAVADRAIQP